MADCKIIIKDGERVGVLDDNNNPSSLFQEILSNPQVSNFDEALQIYKQTKSDKIELPKERVADKLPLTLPVFDLKQFKDLQGKMVNPISVQQMLNGSGIKQIEKDLINQVIEDNYKGQKRVSYDDIEATVRANIIPLERITTSSYADYGMGNLGNGNYGEAKTLIFNAPIEHGVTGHFSRDFKASGRQNIKYQPKQLNENTWVAVEEGYESQANDNNIYQFVGTAGTKEAVDAWINQYNGGREVLSVSDTTIEYNIIYPTVYNSESQVSVDLGRGNDYLGTAQINYDENLSEEQIKKQAIDIVNQKNKKRFTDNYESNINKGMFGHIRVWQDGQDYYVAELQSDYFQKNNAKKNLIENSKEYENWLEAKREELNKATQDFNEKMKSLYIGEEVFMNLIGEVKDKAPKNWEINESNTNSTRDYRIYAEDGIEVAQLSIDFTKKTNYAIVYEKEIIDAEMQSLFDKINGDRKTLVNNFEQFKEDFKKNSEKERLKKIEQLLSKATPQEKQFIASQKIWEQRMVREAIKEASLSGATSLRFPTPYTLSVIEGYIEGNGTGAIQLNSEGSTEIGDTLEYLGEDYTIMSQVDWEDGVRIVKSSDVEEIIIEDFIDDMVANDIAELYIEEGDKFYSKDTLDNSEAQRILDDLLEQKAEEDGTELKDTVLDITADIIEEIRDTIRTRIKDDVEFDPERYFSDWGYTNIVEKDGVVYYTTEGIESEYVSLTQNSASKENFEISNLNDTQQTVARKYEEIAEILKKEKPIEVVTDENGFDWYEAEITEKDKQSPVVAYSIRTIEPNLKYQTKDGRVFQSYSEALKNTNGDIVSAGVNTVDGFKPLFEVESNTNVNTLGGMINNLIKSEMLSDQSFLDVDGNTYLVPEGKNEAKKHINADLIKSLMQKTLGSRSVSITADGNIKINKNLGKIQISEDVFVTPQELKVDFKTLKKEFGMEKAVEILTAQVFNEETSKNKKVDVKEEFVPENELQEKIVKLLKDMGIKTLSFEEYKRQYAIKNGIEPSASALADIANKLIAFRDGRVEEDDLLEETAHMIEASIPQADKENILRNIHKTKEWMEHSDNYMRIYNGNEALVRKEILGKIIANGLKTQFEARNENQTEDSILARLRELVLEFFDRIVAYINPTIESQLNTLNQQIYRKLMNETLANELGEVQGRDVLFSAPNASTVATSIYLNAKKGLAKLTQQSQVLSKNYQSSSDRQYLKKTKEALSVKEKEVSKMELIEAVSNVIRVASSQTNTLKKALETTKADGHHFSSDENNVYISLKKDMRPILLQLKRDLSGAVLDKEFTDNVPEKEQEAIKKQLLLVQEEIKVTLDVLQELETIAPRSNRIALDRMKQRIKDKANMTKEEGDFYDKIIEAALEDNQKDTDTLHAHIGSLLQARNPLLNLAGDNIEKMILNKNYLTQEVLKPLTNGLNALGMLSNASLKPLFKNGYLKHEEDPILVKKIDAEEKTAILNMAFKNAGILEIGYKNKKGEKVKADSVTTENIEDILKDLGEDTTVEGREIRTEFNKQWSKTKKERLVTYRTKAHIEKLAAHPVEIDGKTYTKSNIEQTTGDALALDAQYRSEVTQIRINAGANRTKEDQYRIQEVNKRRAKDANPRNEDGLFIDGLTEVYDEKLKRYVVVLTDDVDTLPSVQSNRARTIFGLNVISLIDQDFYRQDSKDNPKGIPDSFIDALTALQTEEERREFLNNNAYIGFPDSYWEQLSDNKSIVDRLREEGYTELISDIRRYQSIISGVLKQNRVFNRPSETNFNEMFKVHQLAIKDAQTSLEDLYEKARGVLEEVEATPSISESIVNEAYNTEVANQNLDTLDKQLDFIEEHTTRKGKNAIINARQAAANIKGGVGNVSKGMRKVFTEDMSKSELDEVLLNYAKSKLLPYFKKTEPKGFTENMNSMPVLDFIFDSSVVVTPNFSFFEDTTTVNPEWLENNKAGRSQNTKEYLNRVRNKEYFDYFNFDDKGEPTTHLKEWEARKLILKYIDDTIEFNGMTGKQNRYMMPPVRKTGTERTLNLTAQGVKENLKELITFRPEEVETGQTVEGDLAKIGSNLLTIPTQYTRELEDPKELTDDILRAYITYGQAAALHKARKESIGDMLVLEDTLLGVDYKGKNADATNSYKMLQAQIQANYYGVKETFSYEADFGGKKVDMGKLAKVVNSFFKWSNITGLVVPITSLIQSSVQKKLETMVGEVTNSSASKVADRFFLKHAREASKEIMGLTSNAFLNVVGEGLGIYNPGERFENSHYNTGTRTVIKTINGSAFHSLGNFPVITRMFLAVMGDYRYVNGRLLTLSNFKKLNSGKSSSEIIKEWETKEVFLDDVVYATKGGVFDFNNPDFLKRVEGKMNLKGEELKAELQLKKEQMSQKALSAIQRIDNQIPEHQKSMAARDARLNFFLSHMNWLLVQLPLKFKERHNNISEESYQEGNWRTTFNFIKNVVMNPKNIKKTWKDTMGDDVARKNLKRTVAELSVANALVLACVMLAKYVDDDDDPAYAAALADYFLTRVAVEQLGATVALPSSIGSIVENPLMVYSKIQDLASINEMFSGDIVKTGSYKGETERYRFMSKQLYFIREYNRFRDPKLSQDTYNFFQNEKKDLFSHYAVLSNFFDE